MPTKRAKIEIPTDAEEAAIQRGIAQDPDAPELSDAQLAEMRPAADVLPPATFAGLVRRRGPGKRPAMVPVTLKLPPDLLTALRASGPGWQARAGAALAEMVATSAAPQSGRASTGQAPKARRAGPS